MIESEAECLAARSYKSYCAHMNMNHNVAPPRWFALRDDLKAIHVKAAEDILRGYQEWNTSLDQADFA